MADQPKGVRPRRSQQKVGFGGRLQRRRSKEDIEGIRAYNGAKRGSQDTVTFEQALSERDDGSDT